MTKKYIFLITAFEAEFNALVPLIEVKKTVIYAGRVILIGRLRCGKLPLILTMSGVGPINATLTTQAIIDKFRIKYIINVGIAGGVNDKINLGDIIIPETTGLYQQQVYARQSCTGCNGTENCLSFPTSSNCYDIPSFLSGVNYGNYGFIFPQATEVLNGTITSQPPISLFQDTSDKLRQYATLFLQNIQLKQCVDQLCLDIPPQLYIDGTILSGPTFVNNVLYRQWLINNPTLNTPDHPLYSIDEESAAINFVSNQNKIPFMAIRSVSDLAGNQTDPNQLIAFLPVSLANLHLVTATFLYGLEKCYCRHV